MKVIPIREGRPLLNDIPGRLHWLADKIANGDIPATSIIVLIPNGEIPTGHNFGECLSVAEHIGVLELVKISLIRDAAS